MSEIKVGDRAAAAVVAGHSPGLRVGKVEKIHAANGPWTPKRYTLRAEDGSTSVVAASRTIRFITQDDLANAWDEGEEATSNCCGCSGGDNPYREEAA